MPLIETLAFNQKHNHMQIQHLCVLVCFSFSRVFQCCFESVTLNHLRWRWASVDVNRAQNKCTEDVSKAAELLQMGWTCWNRYLVSPSFHLAKFLSETSLRPLPGTHDTRTSTCTHREFNVIFGKWTINKIPWHYQRNGAQFRFHFGVFTSSQQQKPHQRLVKRRGRWLAKLPWRWYRWLISSFIPFLIHRFTAFPFPQPL